LARKAIKIDAGGGGGGGGIAFLPKKAATSGTASSAVTADASADCTRRDMEIRNFNVRLKRHVPAVLNKMIKRERGTGVHVTKRCHLSSPSHTTAGE
jgi:hypothetical protein